MEEWDKLGSHVMNVKAIDAFEKRFAKFMDSEEKGQPAAQQHHFTCNIYKASEVD